MNEIISGFSSGRVLDALLRVKDVLSGAEIAVIRSIDSAKSQEDLIRILLFHKMPYEVTHRNVWLSAENVWRAIDKKVFAIFDEVWIYNGMPPEVDLSGLPSATSEVTDFSQGLPVEIAEAIESTHCVLVLGDGCGLNYATQDERIARRIIDDQP